MQTELCIVSLAWELEITAVKKNCAISRMKAWFLAKAWGKEKIEGFA